MCFGSTSSFVASGVLAIIGGACIERTPNRKAALLAAIPLLFAFQQVQEGGLWMVFDNSGYQRWKGLLTVGFLSIAFLWPAIVPCSIYLIEPDARRKKLIQKFLILGTLVSFYFIYYTLTGERIAVTTHGRIEYAIDSPAPDVVEILAYALSITGAMFISSYRQIVMLGIVNIILCAIAAVMWTETFISVWCFFAAILSALIYFFLRDQRRIPVVE